ncbi:hypothetical protein ACR9KB_04930 [Helicobacter pylori]
MECGSVFIKDKRSKPYLMFFIFLKNKILVILILIKDFNKAHFLKGIGGVLCFNTPTTPQTKSPNLLRSH